MKLPTRLIDSVWGMYNMIDNDCFAVRELFFCRKGHTQRKKLIIRIRPPQLVDESSVSFKFDEGTASCAVEFDGLSELNNEVFGVDKLHALSLAVDIDPCIKSLAADYEFYWLDGAPYFDE